VWDAFLLKSLHSLCWFPSGLGAKSSKWLKTFDPSLWPLGHQLCITIAPKLLTLKSMWTEAGPPSGYHDSKHLESFPS
jgi:hypothetical protein